MNLFKTYDKRRHFAIGFGISFLSAWTFFVVFSNFITLIAAVVVPFIASLVWELIHLKRSKFSWDDIFAAMCGAIINTIFWAFVLLKSDYVGLLN